MKKLFLLFCLLLVACALDQGAGKGDISGTEGLVMTITQHPEELFVGQTATIPIQLENKGLANIDNAILILSGYDPKYIEFVTNRIEGIKLTGRGPFLPIGERTVKSFTMSSVELPDAKQRVETIRATACYTYKTEASPIVCINPQAQFGEQAVKQGCDFRLAQLESSQGAPVAVTGVETQYFSQGKRVDFLISIDDVSNTGTITSTESYAKFCGQRQIISEKDIDVVGIEAYLGGEKIECHSVNSKSSTGVITLQKNGPDAICTKSLDSVESAYTTPLNIYLTYGYNFNDVFSITIKNPSFKSQ